MYRAFPKAELPYEQKVDGLMREAASAALIAEAHKLHLASPSGFSKHAHKLKVELLWSQVSRSPRKPLRALCKVTLSNGSRYRAAWLWRASQGTLVGSWQRVSYADVVRPNKLRVVNE